MRWFWMLWLSLGLVTGDFIVTSDPAILCHLCRCESSPHDRIVCDNNNITDLTIRSVPPTLAEIIIIGPTGKIYFESLSVRAGRHLNINVSHVASITFESKSVSILNEHARVNIDVSNVDNKVWFGSQSISGHGGEFTLSVSDVKSVYLSEGSFDVIRRISISNCDSLTISSTAFKPKVPSLEHPLEINLTHIQTIPVMPKAAFSSAKSIIVRECLIQEISSRAFSGIQFEQISFSHCSIDRLQSNAFPAQSLVTRLEFDDCLLTSVSDFAVGSAISRLRIANSRIASISQKAFHCHVARIDLANNFFQTLVNRSLVFKTWNDFSMVGNTFKFMDGDALAGISSPGMDNNVSFTFRDNIISYANSEALKIHLPADFGPLDVSNNTFERDCDCDFHLWLGYVTGRNAKDALPMGDIMVNSSLCRVTKLTSRCFQSAFVPVMHFLEKICRRSVNEDACGATGFERVLAIFEDQIEIHTNKGILLIILLFAVVFSLLVSIVTLMRWIVYTLQIRAKTKPEEEWNFTKIEERRQIHIPSPIVHYESLPLTAEDEEEELEEVTSEQTTYSPTHDKVLNSSEGQSPKQTLSNKQTDDLVVQDKENVKESSDTARVSVGAPPKMTFYDEMIDLLKEKLEDPDNYATVADTGKPDKPSLYQDPFDIKPDKK